MCKTYSYNLRVLITSNVMKLLIIVNNKYKMYHK